MEKVSFPFNENQENEGIIQDIDRAVSVEGNYLGREFQEFSLRQFSQNGKEEGAYMLGNDAFTEIYFQTRSGNTYKIYKKLDGRFMLLNASTISETSLSEEDLENSIIKIGMPFKYGNSGKS